MRKTWNILGYDTAWVPPNCGVTPSGLEEDCIADPAKIRVLRRVKMSLVEMPKTTPSPQRSRRSKRASAGASDASGTGESGSQGSPGSASSKRGRGSPSPEPLARHSALTDGDAPRASATLTA